MPVRQRWRERHISPHGPQPAVHLGERGSKSVHQRAGRCWSRALLNWSQAQLADAACVWNSAVRNFEAGRSIPVTNNLDAICRAFEAAGVEFISKNGGGAGVRLQKPAGAE